jgi:hypothetical protein
LHGPIEEIAWKEAGEAETLLHDLGIAVRFYPFKHYLVLVDVRYASSVSIHVPCAELIDVVTNACLVTSNLYNCVFFFGNHLYNCVMLWNLDKRL